MREFWDGLTSLGKAKFIGYSLLGIFTVLFAVFNWKETEVHFVVMHVNLPLTIVIVLSMIGGFAFAKIASYRKTLRKEKEMTNLKKQIESQSKDV